MSTVTVTGTYHDGQGHAVAGGFVAFSLAHVETDGSSTIYVGSPTMAALDATGSLSVDLEATDAMSPIASYQVTERIRGAKQRIYWIQVDATKGATQDLAGMTAWTAPVGTSTAAPMIVDLVAVAQAAADAAEASQDDAAASAAAAQAAQAAAEAAAAHRPGLNWIFVGDSIVDGSGSSNFSFSIAPESIAMAGHLIAQANSTEAGTAGNTTSDVIARLATIAVQGCNASVLLIGTNDAGNSVTVPTYAANMTTIIRSLQRFGPVVVCTIPPRISSTGATTRQLTIAYNAWIKTYAPGLGCEVADVWTALANSTTGYLAYDSGDGVHPNNEGHARAAQIVAAAMKRSAARTSAYGIVTAAVSDGQLLGDSLNARSTVIGSGWYEWAGGSGTAPSYSMVADTWSVLPTGRWAQMDFDGTSSGGTRRLAYDVSTGFSVGDVLLAVAHLQVEDVSGTWIADVAAGNAAFTLSFVNQAAATLTAASIQRVSGMPNASSGVYDIGPLILPLAALPSGTTKVTPWFSATVPTGKHVKFRIGGLGLLNATVLGLTASFSTSTTGMIRI